MQYTHICENHREKQLVDEVYCKFNRTRCSKMQAKNNNWIDLELFPPYMRLHQIYAVSVCPLSVGIGKGWGTAVTILHAKYGMWPCIFSYYDIKMQMGSCETLFWTKYIYVERLEFRHNEHSRVWIQQTKQKHICKKLSYSILNFEFCHRKYERLLPLW